MVSIDISVNVDRGPPKKDVGGYESPVHSENFVAFCLDVSTSTFCQLMGFPLNHQKLNLQRNRENSSQIQQRSEAMGVPKAPKLPPPAHSHEAAARSSAHSTGKKKGERRSCHGDLGVAQN